MNTHRGVRAALTWRWAALVNGFKDATAYRIEFLIEILGAAAVPAVVQWVLWYSLFEIGGATQISGMTYSDLIQYTLVSLLFSQVRGGDHDFELAEMIRSGGLSNYLLKPVNVVEFVYLRGLAPRLFISAICLAIGLVVGMKFGLSPDRMILGMALAIIGNLIHYQFGAALASVAFIWEESYSVLMVKNMVVQILSGELIPLSLFPDSMKWIWQYTPFYLCVFGPTQIALGHWSPAECAQQFVIAGMWLALTWIAIRATWAPGIKRYASIGG